MNEPQLVALRVLVTPTNYKKLKEMTRLMNLVDPKLTIHNVASGMLARTIDADIWEVAGTENHEPENHD